ncbi:acetyltransferase [Laribacter hongkongensis]|uniref:acetyltransferase n=1 Tax=Laribacter hongkongensis TaxID=168471 RepID=UPI0002F7A25C|nr:acetyltransferase [Laribacter hongkongensis]
MHEGPRTDGKNQIVGRWGEWPQTDGCRGGRTVDGGIVGFLDDSPFADGVVIGCLLLGQVSSAVNHRHICDQAIVVIGNNSLHETLMQQLVAARIEIASVSHSKAFVSPCAQVAVGAMVMARAVVNTEASIGTGAIVNCGTVVDYQDRVMDYGHCGLNACVVNGSVLGRSSWMKAGLSIDYGDVISDGVALQLGQAA